MAPTELPPKRERLRLGISRRQPTFRRHQEWVKKHHCAIPDCKCEPIEFAHLRTAANSGTGMKPPDWFGIPLCQGHHDRAHTVGHDTMAREGGTTLEKLFAIAKEFARRTPDAKMRLAMSETGYSTRS